MLLGEKRLNVGHLKKMMSDDNEGYCLGWDHDVMRSYSRAPMADFIDPSTRSMATTGLARHIPGDSMPRCVMVPSASSPTLLSSTSSDGSVSPDGEVCQSAGIRLPAPGEERSPFQPPQIRSCLMLCTAGGSSSSPWVHVRMGCANAPDEKLVEGKAS